MFTVDVYTTGGGPNVTDIFNFLATFNNGVNLEQITYISILLSAIIYSFKFTLISSDFRGLFNYILVFSALSFFVFGIKTRVVVKDTTYPLEVYSTVDNVPFPVAVAAHYTTSFSYFITRNMEALLSTPDNLSYQKHGMLFGATLMSQSARWRAVTPSVASNLNNFTENCIIDGANIGILNYDELTKHGYLEDYISSNVPQSLAYYDLVEKNTIRCSDGWGKLQQNLSNEVIKVLKKQASSRNQSLGLNPSNLDYSALTGTLNDFQNYMGMTGYDASRFLKQVMLIKSLDDAGGRLIAQSGNSAAMSLYQAARAEQQTKSSYEAAGENSLKWLPLIKITFEIMYYGAFPLALFLMFTPFFSIVLRGYFGGFVWLAAWEPLTTILHSIMLKNSVSYYKDHTTTLFGDTTKDVINWSNHLGIQSVSQEVGITSGYLMMSVPFLSFAIFMGASKMAGLATSMLNVSQGASIDTGREAATGNIGLSNVSMNNTSANKYNTSSLMDSGRNQKFLSDGSLAVTNHDGSQTFSSGSAQSQTGLNLNLAQTARSELSNRYSNAQRSIESDTEDYLNNFSTLASRLTDFTHYGNTSQSVGSGKYTSFDETESNSLSQSTSYIQDFSEQNGLSTNAGLSALLAIDSAKMSGLPPAKIASAIGASLVANGSLQSSQLESFTHAVSSNSKNDHGNAISSLISLADRAYSDESNTSGTNTNLTNRSLSDRLEQSSTRLSNTYETAQSLDLAQSTLNSLDSSQQQRITDIFVGSLLKDGVSEGNIAKILNPKSQDDMALQSKYLGDYLPVIIDNLPISQHEPIESLQKSERDLLSIGTAQNLYSPQTNFAALHSGHRSSYDSLWDSHFTKGNNRSDNFPSNQSLESSVDKNITDGVISGFAKRGSKETSEILESGKNYLSNFFNGEAPNNTIMGSVDSDGFYNAPNVSYGFNDGTIRDQPVKPEYMSKLSNIVHSMNPNLSIVVTSGGQSSHGPHRTGSHRHDNGGAVDFYLTRDGETLSPNDNKDVYSRLFELAAPHFNGMGHYDWGVHMGGGSSAFWGPDKSQSSADPQFMDARNKGLSN